MAERFPKREDKNPKKKSKEEKELGAIVKCLRAQDFHLRVTEALSPSSKFLSLGTKKSKSLPDLSQYTPTPTSSVQSSPPTLVEPNTPGIPRTPSTVSSYDKDKIYLLK